MPRCEIPHLPVVAIVCQPHLGSNEEELATVNEHTAVVSHIAVPDGHADVQQDILAVLMVDDLGKHLPGMQEGITLEEVIQTAIAGDLIHLQIGPSRFEMAVRIRPYLKLRSHS